MLLPCPARLCSSGSQGGYKLQPEGQGPPIQALPWAKIKRWHCPMSLEPHHHVVWASPCQPSLVSFIHLCLRHFQSSLVLGLQRTSALPSKRWIRAQEVYFPKHSTLLGVGTTVLCRGLSSMQGGMAGSMGGNLWSGPAPEPLMGLSKELTPFIVSALVFPFGVTEVTAVNMPSLVVWPELSRDSLPSQWALCPEPGHYRAHSLHSTTAHILDPHPPSRAAPPPPISLQCTQP